uniref:Uncharacterized protein n=1 Tax=Arundo donax TaxID=35708 RepID=A0A0A9A9N3_ARUDO
MAPSTTANSIHLCMCSIFTNAQLFMLPSPLNSSCT